MTQILCSSFKITVIDMFCEGRENTLEMNKKIGDFVNVGDPLLYIHANNETQGLMQVEMLRQSFEFSNDPVEKPKEILDIVE